MAIDYTKPVQFIHHQIRNQIKLTVSAVNPGGSAVGYVTNSKNTSIPCHLSVKGEVTVLGAPDEYNELFVVEQVPEKRITDLKTDDVVGVRIPTLYIIQ